MLQQVTKYVVLYVVENELHRLVYDDLKTAKEVFDECKQIKRHSDVRLVKETEEVLYAQDKPIIGRVFYTPTKYDNFTCKDSNDAIEFFKTFLMSDWKSISFSRNRKHLK